MRSRKLSRQLSLCFLTFVLSIGCKPDEQKILENFSYDIEDKVLDLNIEFNKTFELNTEFNVPILEYGSIRLEPSQKDRGFIIGGTLNMDIINGQNQYLI